MAPETARDEARRVPLTRERVLAGAIAVADAGGVGALTIRSLASELGVKPMTLYHHVESKEAILGGMIDAIFSEIAVPSDGAGWRSAIRERAISARGVLRRHPWATTLMDSRRNPGPATLRHHDAVIGTLRRAGFSVPMAGHAYSLLDSYIYGFAVQEAALPHDLEGAPEVPEALLERFRVEDFPYLVELATEHALQPGYDYDREFEFGLEVVLDGIERLLAPDGGTSSDP
jgi:AcrR family transcriptional regulator